MRIFVTLKTQHKAEHNFFLILRVYMSSTIATGSCVEITCKEEHCGHGNFITA